jgi:hypothetical protein
MAENQAKSTPARVLFLFTFLMAGMAAALWRDHSVGKAETIDYPTALGDEQLCPVSLLQPGSKFSAIFDRAPQPITWTVASKSAVVKREDRLWKVGLAEDRSFYIYQSDQDHDLAFYWVKSGPGVFYRVAQSE